MFEGDPITTSKFAGADWLEQSLKYAPEHKGKKLTPFIRLVADIWGQVLAGIYHDPDAIHQDWFSPSGGVFLKFHGELATFDASILSSLFVLCHDHAIRFAVSATMEPLSDDDGDYAKVIRDLKSAVRDHWEPVDEVLGRPVLQLSFHPRRHGDGSMFERHPTLEQTCERMRRLGSGIRREAK